MPPLALVVPIALPIAASLIASASGRFGWDLGRLPAASGTLAALIALLAIWIPVRSTLDIPFGALGFGANLDLRLDAVGLAFGLLVLGPASVLLCLQPRTWRESTVASLGVAAAVLLIESRGALLTALAGSTAATLALIQLEMEDVEAPRPAWAVVLAPWLGMAWVGVTLLVQGGTADYDSVPVAALSTPVLMLVAVAAVMASGLYPWRSWAARLWTRPSLRATGIVIATVQPLGIYLLVRAYEMGDCRYPQSTLNVVLVAWGVLVALGAAVRAQAATTRREYMSEVLPGLAGFTLMSVAVGSALGVVAAVILLTAAAIITTCLPLLPQKRGVASLLVVAAAAGVPPSLAFGGRLLGLDSAFEVGGAIGLIGVAGVATWLLSVAAAARSIGLPHGPARHTAEIVPRVATGLGVILIAAGPGLAVGALLAVYVAADVIAVPGGAPLGGGLSISTVSTVMAAVALLGPLLVLGILALILSRPSAPAAAAGEARAPLFVVPGTDPLRAALASFRSAAVPDQYRSLFNPQALERVAAGGTPLLWLATLVALAFAVTR